jgi:hypothetical protein
MVTHAISAAVGAVAAAAILIGLWLAGFTMARDTVNSQLDAAAPSAANAEISARLDKIEHALQARPQETAALPPALDKRLAAVEMQAKMLGDSTAALGHRVDDVAAAAQTAQKQASAGQSGVQQSDVDALASRIAALEDSVKALAQQAAHPRNSADQAARLTVAAEALRAAVERGAPYRAELQAVQSLGADQNATAPLDAYAATGVPPAEILAHELAALVPALRQAAAPSSGETTILGKLKAEAQNLIEYVPAEPPPGDDPASVMTRLAIDADRGDVASALKDIAVLPDRLKSLAADWAKRAQSRQDAIAASRSISAEALAALNRPAAQ